MSEEKEIQKKVDALIKAISDLGWEIAIDNKTVNDDDELRGLIIGRADYVDQIVEIIDNKSGDEKDVQLAKKNTRSTNGVF